MPGVICAARQVRDPTANPMNLLSLLKTALRRRVAPDAGLLPRDVENEPLPLVSTASDIVVTLATLMTLGFAMALSAPLSRDLHGVLAATVPGMVLLLVFSEMFLRRRRVAAAGVVYPFVFGVLAVLSTAFVLQRGIALFVAGGLAWAATGLLFWNRYRAPSAVAQFTTGLFAALVLPVVLPLLAGSVTRGASPTLSPTSAVYSVTLLYGALSAWLGFRFDRLDPERNREYSTIAYWLHAKGALGLTVGLVFPLTQGLWTRSPAMQGAASMTSVGWAAVLVGLGVLGLATGLRWNRKNYGWAGTLCVGAGLAAVTQTSWAVLAALMGFVFLLYEWDVCVERVRRRWPLST